LTPLFDFSPAFLYRHSVTPPEASGMPTLKQNLLAELLGTMFLVIAAIGSTILAFNVLQGNLALAVFMNGIAVAFVLFALIETFGSISGSHFNPAVTLALMASGETPKRKAAFYIIVQFAGGLLGLLLVHLMFYDTIPVLIDFSDKVMGAGLVLAEFIGTFLLVGVIMGCVRGGSKHTGLSVALVVGGMLITTSSTMFANPAVTLSRVFTYAICEICLPSALLFIAAEIAGAIAAAFTFGYLFPQKLKDKCDPFDCKKTTMAPITIDERS